VHNRALGEWGEKIAAAFLQVKGCELIDANVWVSRREIDLLVRDGASLVAVEVKMRWGRRFGTAAEAIDARKMARVRMALSGIAREAGLALSPRVDVIAIDIDEAGDRMTVEHYVGVS